MSVIPLMSLLICKQEQQMAAALHFHISKCSVFHKLICCWQYERWKRITLDEVLTSLLSFKLTQAFWWTMLQPLKGETRTANIRQPAKKAVHIVTIILHDIQISFPARMTKYSAPRCQRSTPDTQLWRTGTYDTYKCVWLKIRASANSALPSHWTTKTKIF
jgi:hypothetical protein